MLRKGIALAALGLAVLAAPAAHAAGGALPPKHVEFSFEGPFGKFDQAQLQRGYKVYREVCSACHSLNRIAFRNLGEIGFSEAEVKAIAKNWTHEVPTINPDTGEASTRTAIPSDKIPLVYANEIAARAGELWRIPPGWHVDGSWHSLGVAAAVARMTHGAAAMQPAVEAVACQIPASL